jgi:hypothetical protein
VKNRRPALFKGRHFQDKIIVLCVRWCLRFFSQLWPTNGSWHTYGNVRPSCRPLDLPLGPSIPRVPGSTSCSRRRKRRINAKLGFRSFDGAWRTIQGYEAMHMIRKGQVRWLPKGDVAEQVRFINVTFGLAA